MVTDEDFDVIIVTLLKAQTMVTTFLTRKVLSFSKRFFKLSYVLFFFL